jgi:hypothetical protein
MVFLRIKAFFIFVKGGPNIKYAPTEVLWVNIGQGLTPFFKDFVIETLYGADDLALGVFAFN